MLNALVAQVEEQQFCKLPIPVQVGTGAPV